MGEAFGTAWAKIANRFRNTPMEIEAARLKLAIALLAVASEEGNSVYMLTDVTLQKNGARQSACVISFSRLSAVADRPRFLCSIRH
jgi:hypothetical protein